MKIITTAFAGLALCAFANVQAAYPDRPVKLIVPWAAGGDTGQYFPSVRAGTAESAGGRPWSSPTSAAPPAQWVHAKPNPRLPTAIPCTRCTTTSFDLLHWHERLNYTDFEPVCLISGTLRF